MEKEVEKFLEIETKYRVDTDLLMPFKRLCEELGCKKNKFLYVESDDLYYTNKKGDFIRYRFGGDKRYSNAELTIKRKKSQGNNIVRMEVNLNANNNSLETVDQFCGALGYERNFIISKYCHIYFFDDANLVFYTVREHDKDKMHHFIEIEIREDLELPKEEALRRLNEYEKSLSVFDIGPKNRLKKSLFEMFVRK